MCPSGYFTRGTSATSTVSNCMVSKCRQRRFSQPWICKRPFSCLGLTSNDHFHSLGLHIHSYLLQCSFEEVGVFHARVLPELAWLAQTHFFFEKKRRGLLSLVRAPGCGLQPHWARKGPFRGLRPVSSRCRYYGADRPAGPNEGIPCQICGGCACTPTAVEPTGCWCHRIFFSKKCEATDKKHCIDEESSLHTENKAGLLHRRLRNAEIKTMRSSTLTTINP